MLLTNTITIKWVPNQKQYYIDKGYVFTKMGDTFEVKVCDLPKNSGKKIKCECDFCLDGIVEIPYGVYANEELHSCKTCSKEKFKHTCRKLYGTEHPKQNKDIQKKSYQTFLKHYPDKESRKEMRERLMNTREKNTGFRSPFSDSKIREKSRKTLLEKTGYDNPWKDPSKKHDYQMKVAKSLYENKTCRTSEQQRHLCTLLNGELNYNIDIYNCDICLIHEKIVIEYDGGGHFIRYKGKEDALLAEMKKENVLFSLGWKIIRVICMNDVLLDDAIMISLIDYSKNILKETNKVVIDITDNSIRYNDKEILLNQVLV